jgi:hypothetical protein
VRYRHYLQELAKKPQAVRQVAPELVAEPGGSISERWVGQLPGGASSGNVQRYDRGAGGWLDGWVWRFLEGGRFLGLGSGSPETRSSSASCALVEA